jgi:uncharacterized membrane-anchored protein
MIPVDGFFEYGIAAVLGVIAMIGLGIFGVVAEDTHEAAK